MMLTTLFAAALAVAGGEGDVRRNDHRHHTWLNCTMEIMSALGRLASVESGS